MALGGFRLGYKIVSVCKLIDQSRNREERVTPKKKSVRRGKKEGGTVEQQADELDDSNRVLLGHSPVQKRNRLVERRW